MDARRGRRSRCVSGDCGAMAVDRRGGTGRGGGGHRCPAFLDPIPDVAGRGADRPHREPATRPDPRSAAPRRASTALLLAVARLDVGVRHRQFVDSGAARNLRAVDAARHLAGRQEDRWQIGGLAGDRGRRSVPVCDPLQHREPDVLDAHARRPVWVGCVSTRSCADRGSCRSSVSRSAPPRCCGASTGRCGSGWRRGS